MSERMGELARAVAAADGRLDPELLADADDVLRRSRERHRMPEGRTVVAISGPTGAGKSSLFNAVAGLDLSPTGVRRPTTEDPVACVWGFEGVRPLLDWLNIPRRNRLNRESVLDNTQDDDMHGLILLDLPGHDSAVHDPVGTDLPGPEATGAVSVELDQRATVDRLLGMSDLVVWVVDPTKYADDETQVYLRRFADRQQAVFVLLNKSDELPGAMVGDCVADLKRLLASNGLNQISVLTISAVKGDGLDDFRHLLAERVTGKRAADERLVAELVACADRLLAVSGQAPARSLAGPDKARALSAFAAAAGVPVLVSAINRSYRREVAIAGAWPPLRWLVRLRPDPLSRLRRRLAKGLARQHKQQQAGPMPPPDLDHIGPTEPVPVQRTRVDQTVRRIVGVAATGLGKPWESSLRTGMGARIDDLGEALDYAVASTDLGGNDRPGWLKPARFLQWLLFLVAAGGGGWAAADQLTGGFGGGQPGEVAGLVLPMFLLVAGSLLGIGLSLVVRSAARSGARRRAMGADRRLRSAIADVAEKQLFSPVQRELQAYMSCREALNAVRGE